MVGSRERRERIDKDSYRREWENGANVLRDFVEKVHILFGRRASTTCASDSHVNLRRQVAVLPLFSREKRRIPGHCPEGRGAGGLRSLELDGTHRKCFGHCNLEATASLLSFPGKGSRWFYRDAINAFVRFRTRF